MLCYEVYINGNKVCLAGVDGAGVLTGILGWVKGERHEADEGSREDRPLVEDLYLRVGGLTHHGRDTVHHVWVNEELRPGDEVRFRIVERDVCDPPINARTDDAKGIEQERREYYEDLKRFYERPTGDNLTA